MKNFKQPPLTSKPQQGIVLLITLIVLVAMTLASVGMMRSVDTSIAAVGNLAFRQAADASTGSALERAVARLASVTPANLDADNAGTGYYASIQANENIKGIPRRLQTNAGAGVNQSLADGAGNVMLTMIERMCNAPGAPTAVSCLGTSGSTEDAPNKAGEFVVLTLGTGGGFSAYYRVTVRVDGPNGTVSFVQAIVSL